MRLKIYNLKNHSKNSKPIGEIIIKEKELIRTISLDKTYICNGKTLDSNCRTEYELNFLDKYDDNYKYGKISIKYIIRQGTSFTAFLKPNFYENIYLKLLFEQYLFQRVKSLKSFSIGVLTGISVTVFSKAIIYLAKQIF